MRNFNSYQPQIHYDESNSSDDSPSDDEQFFPSQPQQFENGIGNHFYTQPDENSKRHPKKRKLESFVNNNSNSNSNSRRHDTWSEQDTFILLETWGEKYLEFGRRSLRSLDWTEVTERVNDMTGLELHESDYRNQLDVLKNKYKKERLKVESGVGTNWVFYNNMDVLLNVRVGGSDNGGGLLLGCGIDSGEYVFMDSRVYLERGNVLDEMRDSPVESDEEGEDEEDGGNVGGGETVRVLAESIKRFGEVYEKIEESKRKQMVELERMREEFQRELEVQKKEIVDRAQAEIARIREMGEEDGEETDNSLD